MVRVVCNCMEIKKNTKISSAYFWHLCICWLPESAVLETLKSNPQTSTTSMTVVIVDSGSSKLLVLMWMGMRGNKVLQWFSQTLGAVPSARGAQRLGFFLITPRLTLMPRPLQNTAVAIFPFPCFWLLILWSLMSHCESLSFLRSHRAQRVLATCWLHIRFHFPPPSWFKFS